MIKWFSIMAALLLAFVVVGCQHLKGKETIKRESIVDTIDIPDKTPGVDLIHIITESGHIVEVVRGSLPKDENGNPYWDVVHVEPNANLEAAAGGVGWIPGVGMGIGAIASTILSFTTANQRRQKQAALDAKQKGEAKLNLTEKVLVGVAAGVEIGTTDGTVKKAIDKVLTGRQKLLLDDITEEKRIEIAAAKAINVTPVTGA